MIFGFNTDLRQGDTIYHVQSEPRPGELLLETQVFVRGRCIGKHSSSYAGHVSDEGFSEQQLQSLLKEQHRHVLDAIRDSRIEELLGEPKAVPLALEYVSPERGSGDPMLLRFRVLRGEDPVPGARLLSRLDASTPVFNRATSDGEGFAEMAIPLADTPPGDLSLLVHASHSGQSATRKFKIRRSE